MVEEKKGGEKLKISIDNYFKDFCYKRADMSLHEESSELKLSDLLVINMQIKIKAYCALTICHSLSVSCVLIHLVLTIALQCRNY